MKKILVLSLLLLSFTSSYSQLLLHTNLYGNNTNGYTLLWFDMIIQPIPDSVLIQRSTDGSKFEDITGFYTKNGGRFEYTDSFKAENVYYRLRTTDKKYYSTSGTLYLHYTDKIQYILYKNYITFNDNAIGNEYIIINSEGKKITSGTISKNIYFPINHDVLFLIYKSKNEIFTIKIAS